MVISTPDFLFYLTPYFPQHALIPDLHLFFYNPLSSVRDAHM